MEDFDFEVIILLNSTASLHRPFIKTCVKSRTVTRRLWRLHWAGMTLEHYYLDIPRAFPEPIPSATSLALTLWQTLPANQMSSCILVSFSSVDYLFEWMPLGHFFLRQDRTHSLSYPDCSTGSSATSVQPMISYCLSFLISWHLTINPTEP